MATTRFDYQCPTCKATCLDVRAPIGFPPEIVCGTCQVPMLRYFGETKEAIINFGERACHDDIERFRFQNL